jgi:hypothetical protein
VDWATIPADTRLTEQSLMGLDGSASTLAREPPRGLHVPRGSPRVRAYVRKRWRKGRCVDGGWDPRVIEMCFFASPSFRSATTGSARFPGARSNG